MTFLAPASAILAAAIAVPVLLMLYLLKLRRRPMRVSTTVFWEQAEKDLQANVPLRWLRPSWLLLLHLLILTLLILALGRPAAELPSSFGGARRVILLIDRSASMSATDGPNGSSRLDAAKEKALKAIDELADVGGSRSATVVSFAGDAAALTRWSSSRVLLQDAVRSIEATDQAGDLAGAMKLMEAIAAGSADDEAAADPPLVLLFSDGSFKVDGPVQAAGLRVKLETVPEEAPLANASASAAPMPASPLASSQFHDNLGVVAIAARRDYVDPTRVRVLVKVQSASDGARAAPLALSLNGEVIERRVVDVPSPQQVNGGGIELGSVTTTFEFLSGEGGLVLVQIASDDLLASDNAASLVLGRPDRPGILLYRPKAVGPVVEGQEPPVTPSEWLLEDALRELRPRVFTIRAVEPAFAMDQADLDGHDLVVFDRVTPSVTPPMASISLGAVPPGLGVSREREDGRGVDGGAAQARLDAGPVLLWERNHALLRDVALDSLYVGKDIGLGMDAALPEGVTELARGRDRPLLVLAEARGVRHVVAGFELAQSNWPSQVSFPIFLASAVEYLTLRGETSLGRSFTTSQAVTLAVKSATGGTGGSESAISIQGPIEAKAMVRANGEVSFGVLPRAGVYLVESARTAEKAVAVNLVDATESALGVKRELTIGATASHAGEGTARREVWPWLVIAAAVLLFVEWILYAVRMRA